MVPTATTVGGYLQTLPPDRRVAMARVCSLIRRNARGVHESMRYGLAFYEYDTNPLFALEPGEKSMTLFVAEPKVVEHFSGKLKGINTETSSIYFDNLNRLPLDIVEKVIRESVVSRQERIRSNEPVPGQEELLKLWRIQAEAAAVPPPIIHIPVNPPEPENKAE
ncbi:DUF1801 domain-containing protein [Mesosutterella sp. OilRF-GAM-744-9]|uniref:DUF1801 domain-containing protein n=1 Tax=Mesosutterella porci TaxID=2915351 RepID=A0ABS9MRD3_9BURK|nr:DUF1801 domain-containing protein [Mesosutterella sp. oilRF-744-WT-GAM-9]MCG5031160.1 DUF1801 domain-containing protein [Mesosutterella sp. oilRF-744-WT-GAM-9]MCI6530364.1 DUF1801 domain-containing protein [Mesosutterella sp.]